MSTIPHTGELLTSSGMPFSIMVQPLAIPSPEEDPIQVVDNGDVGPLRCVRCKASLFLVIFVGYFWLFLVIFGNLRMGNSYDVVFCLQAYMNPFARWLDHGRFQCNFCGATSECPREYMCNLGADGRRMDLAQRPELCRGSVEYAAPG
jgi:protein transport protein SEC24